MANREYTNESTTWDEYRAGHGTPEIWARLDASTSPYVRDTIARGRRFGYLSDHHFGIICRLTEYPSSAMRPSIADEAEAWLASLLG